ncbi:MAG TPA: alkaline phosphatase family protein [Thermoanaerobaculia bacterium]|nr:alkaline phosphatase family protein [Thermoanaerobaculia bacterium]
MRAFPHPGPHLPDPPLPPLHPLSLGEEGAGKKESAFLPSPREGERGGGRGAGGEGPGGGALWLLLLLLLLAGCAQDRSPGRILVLALDGVDPDVVDLLVSEGKLPNFARLRQEGASGRLISEKPLLSPIVWTTIATGKPPLRHGIGDFVAQDAQTGERRPVTSRMRRVSALWNVFSNAERNVAVVGWWATWPPEKVRGAVVSDHAAYHFLFPKGFSGEETGATWPPELAQEIAPLLQKPGDVTAQDLAPFVTVPPEELGRPFDFENDLQHFRWALATARSYRDVGLKLWREEKPDLELVYIEGTDTTSHLFGHLFRAQGLAGELAAQQARYGQAVEAMYVFADGLVGDFLAALDDRTTLAVLSDHGFELGALPDDPSVTRDLRRVSERSHRLEGILYLYGNRVRPGVRLEKPKILDVAPTLLAVAGLAPAKDMPGRVLTEGLDLPGGEPERIATYEKGPQKREEGGEGDAAGDAMVEHLKSLGYLGSSGGRESSPKGDRTLAALHFQEGRLREAEALYAKLVAENPDDAALHASYAGVLGVLGRFDEARKHLEKALALDPLNAEAHHNLAVIHERAGEREQAIEEYRKALRYDPRYEPSQKALVRLTGSDAARPPQTPAEQKARALAEQAADKARRGDYQGARADLNEAARIAPRYALVYQYRANVAWLQGDEKGAVADLERALQLEPDNALYRENLRRLKEKGASQPPR